MNWLLAFVPLAAVLEHAHGVPSAVVFGSAALAIVPLAAWLVHATENIAVRTGPTIGGLLNATFGNAPEMIIAFVALRAGMVEVVKASLVGTILANLLFSLGLAFFVGGVRFRTQEYNPRGVRIHSSVLMLAAIAFILPSIFHQYITPQTRHTEQSLSATVAVVLLVAYAMSLVFMLKTHPEYFEPEAAADAGHEHGEPWRMPVAVSVLLLSSIVLAYLSEILVGRVEETATSLGMSKAFIGFIVLAVVGGAAECYSAVAMARKNHVDLTIGIAIGSSIQIALFVAPTLVLLSYLFAPRRMDLVMGGVGSVVVLLAVLITVLTANDGKANYFKGLLLLCVYALIALFCFFLPDDLGAAARATTAP